MSGRVNSFAAGPVPPEAWAMTERFDVSRDGITLAGERWTARPPSSTCAPWPVLTRNFADVSEISLAIGVPPLALPVAIISPVAPRTATGGPPAGRTTSPGSCLAVPPARPGRHVVALSVHCQPPAAGWLARGSSCRRRAGGWFFAGPRRRCSGGGRVRFPARRRWRVPPGRAGRRVRRRRSHLQRDASPGRREQQGQRVVGPYRRCHDFSPSRRACGGAL
jgi:hypothetical protein